MNKNEVLEKSRAENEMADERERRVQMRTSARMAAWMLSAWALLFIWDSSHGVDTGGLQALALSTISFMSFLNARNNWVFRKESVIGGILSGLASLVFLVGHILGTM